MGDSDNSEELGDFSNCSQSDKSGDSGASGDSCDSGKYGVSGEFGASGDSSKNLNKFLAGTNISSY